MNEVCVSIPRFHAGFFALGGGGEGEVHPQAQGAGFPSTPAGPNLTIPHHLFLSVPGQVFWEQA